MKIFYKNDYRPELWLGDRLLYSTLLEDDLRSEFNITTKVADRKVKLYTDTDKVLDKYIDNLKNHYSGSYYLTDWGDGTKDNLTEHTYAEPGSYTIKTHYVDAYPEVNSYATTILLKINYSIFKKISFNSHILLGYALTQYTSLEGAKVTVDDTTSFFNVEKGLKYFPNISLYGVASVDFENVKTNNMTSLLRAFDFGYSDVEYITGISSWDTSNVTSMSLMFYGCKALKSLDVSGWNTSKVTDMRNMFYNCSSLKSLDLSSWNVSNVYNMENMFYNCSSLDSLNLSTWVFKKGYTAKNMFYNLKYLIDWHYDGTNYANWKMTETYTGFSYVFPWNNKYTSFEYRIEPVNPTEYINSENYLNYLPYLMKSNYDVYKFEGFDILIKKLDGNVYPYSYIENIKVEDIDSIIVTLSSEHTFTRLRFNNYLRENYIKEFVTIPNLGHDAFNITEFDYMFYSCKSLTSLDLSSWDISNVTDMSNMFYYCTSLTSLNVSSWNTSNVTDMNYMFSSCSSLTSLDLSSWDTSKVTNMGYMFNRCSSLNILNLSNFDTSKVTENENMLVGVPANVDWQYDGSGYSKFTLLESDTNFSGVFPWITYKNSLIYTISAEDDTHTLNGNYANYYLPIIHVDTGSGNLITVIKTGVTILKKDGTSVNDITGVLAKDVEQIIIDFTNLKDYTFLGMPYRITEIQKMIGMEFLPNLYNLFFECSLLKSLDLSSWDTSNVTTMSNMFYGCSSLTSLDLSSWDVSNVEYMSNMFSGCSSLTSLDLSSWDVSNVPEMSWMFYKCTSLESLNLSTWDTRKVTNPSAMFYQVPEDVDWHYERGNYTNFTLTESETSFSGEFPWNLDKIIARYTFNSSEDTMPTFNTSFTSYEVSDNDNEDGTTTRTIVRTSDELPNQIRFKDKTGLISVKILDISGITNMSNMFYGCSSLTSLDVSGWNTSSVTNMGSMFYGCSSLTSLDVSGWNTSSVTSMSSMFYGCSSLTSLDVSGWNTSNVKNLTSLFYECKVIDSLDVSEWNTSSVTNMSNMFSYCYKLTSLDVSTWNTRNVTNMGGMFNRCNSLTSLDLSNFDTSNVTDMGWMFCLCNSLTSLDVSTWNTSKVTDMEGVFSSCELLTSLDVSGWNTSSVTNMDEVFKSCELLTSLDVSGWNTSSVTSMGWMFSSCTTLTSLNLSNFDTSNVTDMCAMFQNCKSLTSLDLSNFDTSSVTSMSSMFYQCTSLTSLDLSNFDTSSVTSMSSMFQKCSSLTSLDVSGWNTSKVTNMSRMFSSCSSLTSLDLSNFDTSKVTNMSSMFSGITIEDWHYDGTNYTNWTLIESKTGYDGKFPWNQE